MAQTEAEVEKYWMFITVAESLRRILIACLLGAVLFISVGPARADFVTFETGPVRPLAVSANGLELYATNIPDGELEIFNVTAVGLIKTASVPVGVEPCAVAVASDGRVWVVNHLSDSVSIVDPSLPVPAVVQTLIVGDEPRDIVFAGDTTDRAFITTAHRGQHRLTISGAIGGGDPQLKAEGIGRADVWVFDATAPGTAIGGDPIEIMTFFTDTPRALAVSNDQATVYVAGFHSGNQTTSLSNQAVCNSFNPSTGCINGGLTLPAGMDGPGASVGPPSVVAPFTGSIAKYNNSTNHWENQAGTNVDSVVMFDLPDHDVFAVSADSLIAGGVAEFDHVGTILFNMAVRPGNGKIYVSNIDSPNEVLFEGPGGGGSTVQGRLSLSRVSVLSGVGTVDVRHLNKHIDYSKLHTDTPDLVDPTAKNHSLATPVDMVFSSDGSTLYVAAYGSAKVGVFDANDLESDVFDPTTESANYISTGGGPSGLILDETHNRLYVLTRFDNSINVIDLNNATTFQTVPLFNPEPTIVVEGRPFLYDAFLTSGNGEASCSSCHIFGDVDSLAWNLGNPDGVVTNNNQPAAPFSGPAATFHSMKGPMTTQTFRSIATHGAMHWRGDRLHGIEGEDLCVEVTGAACQEDHSFMNFRVAFEGLVGKDGVLSQADMQKFTDFALQITIPPNPVRNIDNSLTASEANGLANFTTKPIPAPVTCTTCHILDPANGFFGTNGSAGNAAKVPQLRSLHTKVGMFGSFLDVAANVPATHTGDQVRGFGILSTGSTDNPTNFVSAFPGLIATEVDDIVDFLFAFNTDLAPMVGQQVTLDATNAGIVGARIDAMISAASTSFASLAIGSSLKECDLVVSGTVGVARRGWVYRPGPVHFEDDSGATIVDAALRALATTDGPLTYTCVPPGSGTRVGINRDRDAFLDGADNCPDAPNDLQTDTDTDSAGDACDQDDDNDTLLDVYETNTGSFVSAFNTGTDPLLSDTDGDSFDDDFEILEGTDPTNPASFPSVPAVPAASLLGLFILSSISCAISYRMLHRKWAPES